MPRRVAKRRADATLLVAGLLLVPALPCRQPATAVCFHPQEDPRGHGGLPVVRCGPSPGPRRPLRGAPRLLFGLPLDLNRADAHALEALPGIGPVRAQMIVRERARQPFCGLADLVRLPGVGPRTVERLTGRARAQAAQACSRGRPAALYTAAENP